MFVSIVIPSWNEPLLGKLAKEIDKELKNTKHEIIIVEKGDVLPEVNGARVYKQRSNGLGNAVIEGVAKSSGDVIVTMDGDFSHDPKDIPRLLDDLESHDIVIGSRFIGGGITTDALHRRIIAKSFRPFSSIVLNIGVKDSMSGFAAIRKEVYDSIALNPLGYKINLEIMYKAKQKGFTIGEVPIVFRERKQGESKAGLKEVLRIFRLVFRLRLWNA
jgi:dolichol-phosphate mannosyltransferase